MHRGDGNAAASSRDLFKAKIYNLCDYWRDGGNKMGWERDVFFKCFVTIKTRKTEESKYCFGAEYLELAAIDVVWLFQLERALELIVLVELGANVQSTHKLAFDVDLRIGGPAGERLQALAHLTACHDVVIRVRDCEFLK